MVGFWLNNALLKAFDERLKIDGLERKEIVESAINAYLYGDYAKGRIYAKIEID